MPMVFSAGWTGSAWNGWRSLLPSDPVRSATLREYSSSFGLEGGVGWYPRAPVPICGGGVGVPLWRRPHGTCRGSEGCAEVPSEAGDGRRGPGGTPKEQREFHLSLPVLPPVWTQRRELRQILHTGGARTDPAGPPSFGQHRPGRLPRLHLREPGFCAPRRPQPRQPTACASHVISPAATRCPHRSLPRPALAPCSPPSHSRSAPQHSRLCPAGARRPSPALLAF